MDKKNVQNKIHRFLIESALIGLLLVAVDAVVLMVLGSESTQLTKAKQMLSQLKAEQSGVAETKTLLSTYEEHIPDFSNAIPDSEHFVAFVNSLESVANSFSTEHVLRFGTSVPVKEKGNLYIPFTLNLKTTFPEFLTFLNRFERMPYLMSLTVSEIKKKPDGAIDATIQAKIYVQDPFTP